MIKDKITRRVLDCFRHGNKLIFMGCGGSSAMSDHAAGEFLGKGFPAISLTNPAIITAIGNDYGFDEVYSRQITALGVDGDIVIALSTSGKSKSILNGLQRAREMGLVTIDWPRNRIKKNDLDTARIQEYQLKLIHNIYLAVDKYFK